jgi:NitT/TauT family transport system ATP-binding protein
MFVDQSDIASIRPRSMTTQMVRWGQAPYSNEMLATAKSVFPTAKSMFRPDLMMRRCLAKPSTRPASPWIAFTGPLFDANDIERHLAAFEDP